MVRGCLVDLAATYSPTPGGAVPWARRGFTAEFGMGRVGHPRYRPPGRPSTRSGDPRSEVRGQKGRGSVLEFRGWQGRAWARRGAKVGSDLGPLTSDLLGAVAAGGVEVGWAIRTGRLARCRACTSGLSTWWSTTALMARPGFAVGFPLRCLQRLSRPNLATRLCRGRDNRSTGGTSTPVLSY